MYVVQSLCHTPTPFVHACRQITPRHLEMSANFFAGNRTLPASDDKIGHEKNQLIFVSRDRFFVGYYYSYDMGLRVNLQVVSSCES